VSTATVSRALAMPGVVTPKTRARVEAAVRDLDYKPNALASSLRRLRTENIVVVVPDIYNPFFSGVVQGIEHVAHTHGHKVLLGESQNNQQRLDTYAAMLVRKEADGLILLGALLPSIAERAVSAGVPPPVPIVMACEYFAGLQAPNVRIDNVAAAAAATDHLLQLGHRRIAMITGPSGDPLVKDRLKGYRQQLARADVAVPADYVARGDFTLQSGYQAMQKLFALAQKPTAVFCANDEMAMGAIRAAKDAGKRVPQDLSVVGFDDIQFAEYYDPPLTTIRQPRREIGETAMRLILDVFAKRNAPTSVVLPHALVVRGSTKALR
jgi:LacI family transcriptional regulator, repressor for deo operon, udp, cdd, tsx, nupC, and nupG